MKLCDLCKVIFCSFHSFDNINLGTKEYILFGCMYGTRFHSQQQPQFPLMATALDLSSHYLSERALNLWSKMFRWPLFSSSLATDRSNIYRRLQSPRGMISATVSLSQRIFPPPHFWPAWKGWESYEKLFMCFLLHFSLQQVWRQVEDKIIFSARYAVPWRSNACNNPQKVRYPLTCNKTVATEQQEVMSVHGDCATPPGHLKVEPNRLGLWRACLTSKPPSYALAL